MYIWYDIVSAAYKAKDRGRCAAFYLFHLFKSLVIILGHNVLNLRSDHPFKSLYRKQYQFTFNSVWIESEVCNGQKNVTD